MLPSELVAIERVLSEESVNETVIVPSSEPDTLIELSFDVVKVE